MKKALILTACMMACACQPKATTAQPEEKREEKPKGGCCEVEKPKAQESQTVSTPEIKVEKAQ